jgi:hypothetical protein
MVGLVTLLLSLVLGLLAFTATAVRGYSLGPVVVDIDLALKQYGPEAAGAAQAYERRRPLLQILERSFLSVVLASRG